MNHNAADGSARWTLLLTLAGLLVAVAAAIGTWYGVLDQSTATTVAGTASVGTGLASVGEQHIGGDVSITGPVDAVQPSSAPAAGTAVADVGIATVGEQTIDGSVTIDAAPVQTRP